VDRDVSIRLKVLGSIVPGMNESTQAIKLFTGTALEGLTKTQIAIAGTASAFVAASAMMIKSAYDFEKKMLNLRVAATMTTEEYAKFKNEVFQAANACGRGADEVVNLAEAFRAGGGDLNYFNEHMKEMLSYVNQLGDNAPAAMEAFSKMQQLYQEEGQSPEDAGRAMHNLMVLGSARHDLFPGRLSNISDVAKNADRYAEFFSGGSGDMSKYSTALPAMLGALNQNKLIMGMGRLWSQRDKILSMPEFNGWKESHPDYNIFELYDEVVENAKKFGPAAVEHSKRFMVGQRAGTVKEIDLADAMYHKLLADPGVFAKAEGDVKQQDEIRKKSWPGIMNHMKNIGTQVSSGIGIPKLAGAGAIGVTAAIIGGILGKKGGILGGLGGLGRGIAEGKGMAAIGVTPVYVVNFSEIGGGVGLGGLLKGKGAGGLLDQFGNPIAKSAEGGMMSKLGALMVTEVPAALSVAIIAAAAVGGGLLGKYLWDRGFLNTTRKSKNIDHSHDYAWQSGTALDRQKATHPTKVEVSIHSDKPIHVQNDSRRSSYYNN